MKPYLNVITIGGRTHGKPFGMYIFEYDGAILFPVSFESFNANGASISSKELEPTIPAQENLKNDFGDLDETCLKTAMSYIFGKGDCLGLHGHSDTGNVLYHGKALFGILKNNN